MASVIDQVIKEGYAAYHADTVEVARGLPDESVGFSVFSPPFESLYTYSNSDRDMGNSKDSAEFWQQYLYLIREQFRVMKPGRIIAIHCMNLPTSKQNDGFIGIRDFRGEIIREYQKAGFIYHSEVVIWKDPVIAMQRTKALGLLHKTIKKDSSMSRMGIPDSLVMMRKPGDNVEPIEGAFTYYVGDNPAPGFKRHQWDDGRECWTVEEGSHNTSVDVWQRYASPVWDDINQTDTLNFREGRDSDDERHICPLQLDVIQRCLQLWSNPGDIVWSPFMGIGSEGYMSIKAGRKFIGAELKESYFKLACRNLEAAKETQYDLF
ncbi:MAG: site-specific DNA-methyltransferase [Saprospiraceae bacterium]|nr:site-specific DNA-methyltransferase [Saprospiraceae bacterium]